MQSLNFPGNNFCNLLFEIYQTVLERRASDIAPMDITRSRTATSRYFPLASNVRAMQISQAITSQPPKEGFANTRMPAIISIPPTICINKWAEKDNREAMPGCKYLSQSVRRSVNLSNPAIIGTIPKVILNIAQTDL